MFACPAASGVNISEPKNRGKEDGFNHSLQTDSAFSHANEVLPLITILSELGWNLIASKMSNCYSYADLADGADMNWDIVEGNWKQFKGKIKEEWGKLNDNHLDKIAGVRDQVAGKKQETSGLNRVEADKKVKADKSDLH
jgi:uncharacterized protein YjbJ (UPF0337 family)